MLSASAARRLRLERLEPRLLLSADDPMVIADVRLTDPASGASILTANEGDVLQVDVTVQDIRDPDCWEDVDSVDELGVFAAYFNFTFPANLTLMPDAFVVDGNPQPFRHGPDYSTLNKGTGPTPFPAVVPGDTGSGTPTLIRDLGGTQTDIFGGPRGPAQFGLVSFQLLVGEVPLTVADDPDFVVGGRAVASPLDVLANDGQVAEIRRLPATGDGKEVLVFLADVDPDSQAVPESAILGGQPSPLLHASIESLTIESVSAGSAEVGDSGTPLDPSDDVVLYTPDATTSQAEIVYRVTTSQGSQTATATVTINRSWHNILLAEDVTNDRNVDQADVQAAFAFLIVNNPSPLDPAGPPHDSLYVDVIEDQFIAPEDVRQVFAVLLVRAAGAEREAPLADPEEFRVELLWETPDDWWRSL